MCFFILKNNFLIIIKDILITIKDFLIITNLIRVDLNYKNSKKNYFFIFKFFFKFSF